MPRECLYCGCRLAPHEERWCTYCFRYANLVEEKPGVWRMEVRAPVWANLLREAKA